MNKILLSILLLISSLSVTLAQGKNNSDKSGSFRKENLFTGGTLNLLFGNNMTSAGATPCIGYSITDYLDAGLTFGIDYTSYRDYEGIEGARLRQTIFTPGAFLRLFLFPPYLPLLISN